METRDKNKYAEFARARNKVKAISRRNLRGTFVEI